MKKQPEGKAQARKRRNNLKFKKRCSEKRRETGNPYWGAARKHYAFIEIKGKEEKKAALERLGLDKLPKGHILRKIVFWGGNKVPNKNYESLQAFVTRVREQIKNAKALNPVTAQEKT